MHASTIVVVTTENMFKGESLNMFSSSIEFDLKDLGQHTVKPFASKFLHMDEILKDWSMKGLTTHHIITLEPMGRF